MNNICPKGTTGAHTTTTIMIMSSRSSGSRYKSSQFKSKLMRSLISAALLANLTGSLWSPAALVGAVSVQRLTVPDLVVVDRPALNQPPGGGGGGNSNSNQRPMPVAPDQAQLIHTGSRIQSILSPQSNSNLTSQKQPEAASLINFQDLSSGTLNASNGNESPLTFECLISYDRKKDKNLIIKWHHDDRVEPIYQWIVELDKISIAPQYKPYILANNSSSISQRLQHQLDWHQSQQLSRASASSNSTTNTSSSANNQVQLLEASFKLIRPSKELGGKYTCSAISVQNDDSKWRKMVVFTPPRTFRFNVTRTDFGQQQPDRLLGSGSSRRTNVPAAAAGSNLDQAGAGSSPSELPLAYRSRGFDGQPASTISPQMYKTIDYVNVNPNYRPSTRLAPAPMNGPATAGSGQTNLWQQQQPQPQRRLMASNGAASNAGRYSGIKLLCDIDQIFPVPEVSIYRLATTGQTNGSHPMDKLTKSETRIEKNPLNGLYHIQVISVLLDDEIELKYGQNEPVYFECLIGLTNLELSKYSDNKRSLLYRRPLLASPASSSSHGMQNDQLSIGIDDSLSERSSSSSSSSFNLARSPKQALVVYALLMINSLLLISQGFLHNF